jgi:hypothetical protein
MLDQVRINSKPMIYDSGSTENKRVINYWPPLICSYVPILRLSCSWAYPAGPSFYPSPVLGYNAGPERDGSLLITVRTPPQQWPPILEGVVATLLYSHPNGHFLIGDRASPRELHYAWVSSPYWTSEGRCWKALHRTASSAVLHAGDAENGRFGQPGHPVVNVTWYEANAYC